MICLFIFIYHKNEMSWIIQNVALKKMRSKYDKKNNLIFPMIYSVVHITRWHTWGFHDFLKRNRERRGKEILKICSSILCYIEKAIRKNVNIQAQIICLFIHVYY